MTMMMMVEDGCSATRFLQRRHDHFDSKWWEEVTDEAVLLAKVSNSVRAIRKRNSDMAKQQVMASRSHYNEW
jgi:hypothetical protein